MNKSVRFDLSENKIFETYSVFEYDRLPICSILYLRNFNQINDKEWKDIFLKLNFFKTREMIVHNKSICNIRLH